jgi:hypothetical protein
MKKDMPLCRKCEHMKLTGRAINNGNNRGLKGPRAGCMCEHSDAVKTFNRVCPRSPRMAGFIGYTNPGGNVPQTKTSPRRCPLRNSPAWWLAKEADTHETCI